MDTDNCAKRSFCEVFDISVFAGKDVCVCEIGIANVDFLIADLANALGYPIVSFYDTKSHYKSVLGQYHKDCNVAVRSHLDGDDLEISGGIVDDVFTMKERTEYRPSTKSVYVYRSDTCKARDYYDFDLVVEVTSLKSGVSLHADGNVKVFDRDNTYYDAQYKVTRNKILYESK